MKVLCVAEKPSIAKSVSSILCSDQRPAWRKGSDKYCSNFDFTYNLPPHGWVDMTVTSVLGHLTEVDLPERSRGWHSCDPLDVFDLPVETRVAEKMKQVATNLRNEARRSNILMIWTDCDREGEHIGSEIIAECRKTNPRIQIQRARFSAIIANQIHTACQNAGELDWAAASAVEARQELDLRVGAAMTRLQTLDLQRRIAQVKDKVISYGPCQFPTLGFVVDRYERIQNFVPESFWSILVLEERRDAPSLPLQKVEFKWKRGHLFDEAIVKMLHQNCKDEPEATVTRVNSKPTKKFKPYPLTTVELQKSGSRLLRMPPKKILDLAEALYQKGFVSYPRTETDQYDPQFDFHSLIRKQTSDADWGQYAQGLENGGYERPRNGKKNDKAHPPIHPTAHANNLSAEERKVYEYITRRFLASCSKDAQGTQSTVDVEIADEEFSAHGLIVQERNYLDVFVYDKWGGSVLPRFQQGEKFRPKSCTVRKGTTTAPNLLTEADLVGLMDKNGIGTDATIAEHIHKVIARDYVKEKKVGKVTYLLPSPLGRGLVEGYNRIDFEKSLSKPILRRETEYRMNLICQGQRTKQDTLVETIDEYKAVFLRARAQFDEVARSVASCLEVGIEDARGIPPSAAPPPRAPRANQAPRRNDHDRDDDDGHDSDDGDDGPAGGGAGIGVGVAGPGPRATAAAARRAGTTNGRPPARGPQQDAFNHIDDFDNGQQSSGGNNSMCSCGEPAVKRTVNKEGANKGRKFWTCGKAQSDTSRCGHFDWASDNLGGDLLDTSNTHANTGRVNHAGQSSRTNNAAQSSRSDNVGQSSRARSIHTTAASRTSNMMREDDDLENEFKDVFDVDVDDLDEYGDDHGDDSVVFVNQRGTAATSAAAGPGRTAAAARIPAPVVSPTRAATRAIIDELLAEDEDNGKDDDENMYNGVATSPSHDRRVGRIDEYRAWFASLAEGDDSSTSALDLNRFNNQNGSNNTGQRCDCGLQTSIKTVSKEGANRGRQFYSCPKEASSVRCNYFLWADEDNAEQDTRRDTRPSWERPSTSTTSSSRNGSGNTGGNNICFKCGQNGHWANECRNDGPLLEHQRNNNSSRNTGGTTRKKRSSTGSNSGRARARGGGRSTTRGGGAAARGRGAARGIR